MLSSLFTTLRALALYVYRESIEQKRKKQKFNLGNREKDQCSIRKHNAVSTTRAISQQGNMSKSLKLNVDLFSLGERIINILSIIINQTWAD